MNTRERQNGGRERPQAGGGTTDEHDLDTLSAAAQRLLAAGDAAIDRALSENSDAFLRANRQHGGQ